MPPTAGDSDGPRDPRDRIGTMLAGRYELVEYLGGGAQGEVYAGIHTKIGRRDAIKILKSRFRHDSDAVARFTRGAANASRISHPNVCTVYDFGETDEGLPFLASEFVSGETLGDILERDGALKPERVVDIARQVASALEAAHQLGIVHRDLKPDNIMLTTDAAGRERVKVVDFDIAKGSKEGLEGGITRGGWVVGTPQYMSPEQLSEDALDGRSDIYSMAVVLFKALTGRLPTRSASTQDLMVERLTQDALLLSEAVPDAGFPPALERALAAGLARKREDRPPRAMDFAHQLAASLTGGAAAGGVPATELQPVRPEVPATTAGPGPAPGHTDAPSSTGLPGDTRRWVQVAVGGAVAAVVLFGGWSLLSGGRNDAPPVDDGEAPPHATTPEQLQAIPAELDFSATVGESPDPGTVAVSTVSGSAAPVEVRAEYDGEAGSWLDAALDGSQTPTTLRVTPRSDGLTAGTYTGRLVLRLGSEGAERAIPVRMDLAEAPGPGPGPQPSTADLAARARRMLVLVSSAGSDRELRAVRDSTAPLWENRSLPDRTRALAAYVHGLALSRLGEGGAEACRLWARRALDLAPDDESYQRQLEGCGS